MLGIKNKQDRLAGIIVVVVFFSSFCFLIFSSGIWAKTALVLEPARQLIELEPGQEGQLSFEVLNEGNSELSLSMSIVGTQPDFSSNGSQIITNDQKYPAMSWVSLDSNTVKVAEGQSQEVFLAIDVPLQAEKGSYFVGLFVSQDSSLSGSLGQQVGVVGLIELRVGDDHSGASLVVEEISGPRFLVLGKRAQIGMLLSNLGRYNIKPQGKITLGNQSNSTVLNPNQKLVLAESQLFLEREVSIETAWWKNIGPVEVTVVIEADGSRIEETITIWFVSWPYLFIVIFLVGVVPFLVFLYKKYFKKVDARSKRYQLSGDNKKHIRDG